MTEDVLWSYLRTQLEALRSQLLKMRYVKHGDFVLTTDHNTLVDYAHMATDMFDAILRKLEDLEHKMQAMAGGLQYAPASGVSVYEFIKKVMPYGISFISDIDNGCLAIWDEISQQYMCNTYISGYGGGTIALFSFKMAPSTTYGDTDLLYIPSTVPYTTWMEAGPFALWYKATLSSAGEFRGIRYLAALRLKQWEGECVALPLVNENTHPLILIDCERNMYVAGETTPRIKITDEWFVLDIDSYGITIRGLDGSELLRYEPGYELTSVTVLLASAYGEEVVTESPEGVPVITYELRAFVGFEFDWEYALAYGFTIY